MVCQLLLFKLLSAVDIMGRVFSHRDHAVYYSLRLSFLNRFIFNVPLVTEILSSR